MRFVKQINGIEVCFYADLYVHIPSLDTLVISDLHMGKAGHFRKNGIPLPTSIHRDEMLFLEQIVQTHQPKKVIITGDLMHSKANSEFKYFFDWVVEHTEIDFILTVGNHDFTFIRAQNLPSNLMTPSEYHFGGFSFAHEHQENAELFMFSGHLHPMIKLRGKGRQSQSLKAFILHEKYCLMPALGFTTFGKSVKLLPSQEAFVAIGDQLLQVDYDSFSKISR